MAKFIPSFKARLPKLSDPESEKNEGLKLGSCKESGQEDQPPVSRLLAQMKRLSTQLFFKVPTGKLLYRRYSLWFGLGVGGGIIAFGTWWLVERSLPDTAELFTVVRNETLTILAADSTILQQQGPATREQSQLEEMPKPLIQAFIASEDRRF